MSTLSPPPVPQGLPEMLKEHPEHFDRTSLWPVMANEPDQLPHGGKQNERV
jgi:hypothetical protein